MYKHPKVKQQLRQYGDYIRKIRRDRELSVDRLAELSSVNPLTIQRIEQGENFTMMTHNKIMMALGLDPVGNLSNPHQSVIMA